MSKAVPAVQRLPTKPDYGGGLLTAAAVVMLITAALDFILSGFFVGAWLLFNALEIPVVWYKTLAGEPGETQLGATASLSLVLACVVLAKSIPKAACAIGLLRRRQWAIYLGLILAFLAGAVALVIAALVNVVPAAWIGAYSAFMFYALLPQLWRRGSTRPSESLAPQDNSSDGLPRH